MKQKDTMTKRMTYECNELDTIAELLEEQAAAGWALGSKTGVIWGFHKSEPRRVQFNVEVVDTDVVGDALEEFIAFCEADGWKHAFDAGKIQIFENEDLEAEPIHTDPEVKLKIVHDRCKATRLLLPGILFLVFVFLTWKLMSPIGIYQLTSWNSLFMLCILPVFGIIMAALMIDYIRWYKQAKRAVECGQRPVYKRSKISKYSDLFLVTVYVGGIILTVLIDAFYGGSRAYAFYMVGLFAFIIGFCWFLFPRISAKRGKKKSNGLAYGAVAAVIAICAGLFVPGGFFVDAQKDATPELPLTQEDLGIAKIDAKELSLEKSGTFLLKELRCDDYSGSHSLIYTVYTTKYKKVYDLVIEDYLVATEEEKSDWTYSEVWYNYKEVDEPAFEAKTVYYNADLKSWLLLYDNRIVHMYEPKRLSDAQKGIVAEKLTGDLEAR